MHRDCHLAAGAGPNFLPSLVISSSNRLRAFFQVWGYSGTAQAPFARHEFSPGLPPQPPCPRQSLCAWQVWARAVAHLPCPAHSLSLVLALPLHVFKPRQICGSPNSGFLAAGWLPCPDWFWATASSACEPANSPPKAAAASCENRRRSIVTGSIHTAPKSVHLQCVRPLWYPIHRSVTNGF
jgi:hypothetical protein